MLARERRAVVIRHLDEMPRDSMIRAQLQAARFAACVIRLALFLGQRIPPGPADDDAPVRRGCSGIELTQEIVE